MRVLITGVTGMTGSYLAEYILAIHPAGLDRRAGRSAGLLADAGARRAGRGLQHWLWGAAECGGDAVISMRHVPAPADAGPSAAPFQHRARLSFD